MTICGNCKTAISPGNLMCECGGPNPPMEKKSLEDFGEGMNEDQTRHFSTGSRRDSSQGKPPLSKLMWTALEEVANVHKYGDDHYGAGNWRKGQPYSEVSSSLLRHWKAVFCNCKDHDTGTPEKKGSGLLHSAHLAWNALFLLHMQLHPGHYAECDDRMDDFGNWFSDFFANTSLAKELEEGGKDD